MEVYKQLSIDYSHRHTDILVWMVKKKRYLTLVFKTSTLRLFWLGRKEGRE